MTVGAGIAEDGEGGDGHPLRQPKWFVASTIAQAQLQLHPVDRRHGAIVGRGLRAVTRSGVGLPSPTDRIRSRREMNNLSSTLHCPPVAYIHRPSPERPLPLQQDPADRYEHQFADLESG